MAIWRKGRKQDRKKRKQKILRYRESIGKEISAAFMPS